ncbi:transporter [Pseudohongiella spirulinae]|uniref:Transporter n=1 Tax=Pseudohongiella spirulinae TaxID=1249552 RepID=A0A0S2KD29_9GAMM|nr:transporter [Pseudohongiella spirulinae]ALO46085.1 hypothetical protein PS2015_1428 [Pseudohongiella spirulinae]
MIRFVFGLVIAPWVSTVAYAAESDESSLSHTTSAGIYYSRGTYGEQQATRIRYSPVSHEVSSGPWRAKATLSRVEIAGPGNVLVNVGNIGRAGEGAGSESGAGDVLLNLTYEVPTISNRLPFFDIGVEIKIPTADENRGLGTGKVDSSMQLDFFQTVGNITLFGTAAWKYRQSSEFFPQLRNSWLLSAGASIPLTDSTQVGFFYDYQQAVSDFSGATREWVPYVNWRLSDRWSLMLYAVKGFTDDSADRAAGMQLGLRW